MNNEKATLPDIGKKFISEKEILFEENSDLNSRLNNIKSLIVLRNKVIESTTHIQEYKEVRNMIEHIEQEMLKVLKITDYE